MSFLFGTKTEFDDLIFENRNKEYGAFPLRKRYNFIVILSTIVGSLIVSLLVIIPFLNTLHLRKDDTIAMRPRYSELKMEKMEPPREEIYIPPAPAPPPNTIANVKYEAPVVVDSIVPVEKQLPTVAEVQSSDPNNNRLTVSGTGINDKLINGEGGEVSDEPYVIVEVPPTFKGGGMDKFREWVQKKTNYPQLALDNGIHGTVRLTFVIERDGSVSSVRVIKGVDKLLDDEAVKAIESSPKWTPGLQRGKPVRFRFQIPLVFSSGR